MVNISVDGGSMGIFVSSNRQFVDEGFACLKLFLRVSFCAYSDLGFRERLDSSVASPRVPTDGDGGSSPPGNVDLRVWRSRKHCAWEVRSKNHPIRAPTRLWSLTRVSLAGSLKDLVTC